MKGADVARNTFPNNMKKNPSQEVILKMNELHWDKGLSLNVVARELKSSLPMAQRVVAITRTEYLKMKKALK